MRHTSTRLKEVTGQDLWAENVEDAEIVLTHPNLWDEPQRNFLRDAAIRARLITRERANTNLYFIEEAEAAARYSVSRYSTVFGRLLVKPASIIFYLNIQSPYILSGPDSLVSGYWYVMPEGQQWTSRPTISKPQLIGKHY